MNKFGRNASAVMLAAATTASAAFVMTTSSRSRSGSAFFVADDTSLNKNAAVARSAALQMNFFSDLQGFLGGGGGYAAGIDYEALDHPGPELGTVAREGRVLQQSDRDPNVAVATFAGGCFWGLELAYQRVPGVLFTATGYTQGVSSDDANPSYSQVCAGNTGHTEAVMVYYDPTQCPYDTLLDTFVNRVDLSTINGQGSDFGTQYRTGVYFHTPEQETSARQRFALEQADTIKYKTKPIASELKAATPFWPAEKYHQQYLSKGGRTGSPQNAEKGSTETIRCYG
eukprot:scaffold28743_cov45-Attheya_sp.AAC.3